MSDPRAFSRALAGALEEAGVAASVVMTSNRVRMVSTRRRSGLLEVRVAGLLADKGEPAIEAISAFVAGEPSGREAVRALLDEITVPPRPPRRAVVRTRGIHHDLAAIAARERRTYFADMEAIPISWGRRQRPRPQRSIRLGSYDPQGPLIRIHSRLDHVRVPGWFIGFVVFHELLHHALGIGRRGGRRTVHPPEFRRLEAQHAWFEAARRWEREVLPQLLACRL